MDLGNAIVNFSRVVPDGLLVFFPSYSVLAACHAAWQVPSGPGKPSIEERILKHKALVVEPRTSADFGKAIADFEEKLYDPAYTGAVFFAVCRGKVSEGLDFADRAGRAVIVTGLPYPAFKDPKVRLKRTFLDESPRIPGLQQLSGTEWYGQQASRAVNQAIGRVIRHRGDYGAVILADARFGQPGVRSQLSRWIRPFVQTYDNFGTFAGGIQKFFRHAQATYPDKEPRPKRDGAAEARKMGEEGSKEVERANKAWSVSGGGAGSGVGGKNNSSLHHRPTLKASAKQASLDWNESYEALTDGLETTEQNRAHVPTLVQRTTTNWRTARCKPAAVLISFHVFV